MTVGFEQLLLALLLAAAAFYLLRSLRCFFTSMKTGKGSCPNCSCSNGKTRNK